MKKLITLLLVLTGCVMTAMADDDTWTLKGSFDSWGAGKNFSAGTTSLSLTAGDVVKFKIVKNSSTWYGGNKKSLTLDWSVNSITDFATGDNGRNMCLFAPLTGTYTLTLTITDGNPTNLSITSPSGTWEKSTIYFCNTLSWATPYFYIRTNGYWDNNKGSGANDCPNGMLMTRIGTTNIWKAEYPTVFFDADVAFLDQKQDSYDNFYNAKASVRGDFSTSKPVFVPNTTSNDSKNGTTYYSNGGWHAYPTYTRTVTEGNFGTICLPFAAAITGATVYEITSKVVDGSGNITAINLSEVDNPAAGVAYIFKATGTTLTATLSGNYADVATGNAMMGSYTGTTVPKDNYIVYQNKIRKAGTGVTVGEYKGYIIPDNIDVATSRSANFLDFDNETTGIAGVEMNDDAEQKEVYNLNGQRVMNPNKGLYIVNGKKVIIK